MEKETSIQNQFGTFNLGERVGVKYYRNSAWHFAEATIKQIIDPFVEFGNGTIANKCTLRKLA